MASGVSSMMRSAPVRVSRVRMLRPKVKAGLNHRIVVNSRHIPATGARPFRRLRNIKGELTFNECRQCDNRPAAQSATPHLYAGKLQGQLA